MKSRNEGKKSLQVLVDGRRLYQSVKGWKKKLTGTLISKLNFLQLV